VAGCCLPPWEVVKKGETGKNPSRAINTLFPRGKSQRACDGVNESLSGCVGVGVDISMCPYLWQQLTAALTVHDPIPIWGVECTSMGVYGACGPGCQRQS